MAVMISLACKKAGDFSGQVRLSMDDCADPNWSDQ
jgi:hypothetical protein